MLFADLIGQEVAKRTIRRAWDEGRLGGSYLFYGPEGVGKEAAAMELAQALNCREQDPPCRSCSHCRRIASYQHPDFFYLMPVPHSESENESWKINEEVAEQLKKKSQHPHHQPFFDRPTAIAIDDIRNLKQGLMLQPYEGGRKVVVISSAERMTEEAANAFLKILEEPSPTTVFILISSRPHVLLPTISSRCQKVRFDLVPPREIEAFLIQRLGLSEVKAKLMADLSAGSLGRALSMMDDGFWKERDLAWEILERAVAGDYLALLTAVGQAAAERGRPERILDLIQEIGADMLHLRYGHMIVNTDRSQRLRALERNFPEGRLEDLIRRLEEAKDALRQNVTPKLCLLAAVLGDRA